jgi:superfamily II DNA/RNA helicase
MADTRPTTPVSQAHAPATFASLGVPARLVSALDSEGIDTPFPIQTATLPDSLAGRDLLGRGKTGSGKTLGFAIPLIVRLSSDNVRTQPSRPRALVLAPTRELALQINEVIGPLAKAMGLRTTTIFGGVSAGPQISILKAGVDIVVACPGRLMDHIEGGYVSLDAIEVTVLDEADHMADLGFLPVVKKLLDRTPKGGQRLLFSATLDNGIDVLVKRYLQNPVTHSVDSAQSPVAEMSHHVLHIQADDRLPILVELTSAPGRSMVFTRTKHGAKKLTKQLVASGIPAVEMHGNLAQAVRVRNLAMFSDGRAVALVATDIAARGIHVDDVLLVIHADPPMEHKAYLHRSGRTARAGASGTVITMMANEQQADVRDLTRRAGIHPTTTKVRPGDAMIRALAPGDRRVLSGADAAALVAPPASTQQPSSGKGPRQAAGHSRGAQSHGQRRSGSKASSGRSDGSRTVANAAGTAEGFRTPRPAGAGRPEGARAAQGAPGSRRSASAGSGSGEGYRGARPAGSGRSAQSPGAAPASRRSGPGGAPTGGGRRSGAGQSTGRSGSGRGRPS